MKKLEQPILSENRPERQKRPDTVRERLVDHDRKHVESEAREKQIEIRKNIAATPPKRERKPLTETEREQYLERHLPEHLKGKAGKVAPAAKAFGAMFAMKERLKLMSVDGRENIPEQGPFLVISNHSGGETGALLGVFRGHALRIAAGTELNWKRSKPRAWLLKQMGMLSINETLTNLSKNEKAELLTRVKGKAQQDAYRGIVDRESKGRVTPNMDFLRSALATLLQGDAVAMFPEGLFLYDGKRKMRKAYNGLEVIAEEYRRLTGEELPILPVGVSKKRIGIGSSVLTSENTTGKSTTDWVMSHIAKQLPEVERGVYKD